MQDADERIRIVWDLWKTIRNDSCAKVADCLSPPNFPDHLPMR